MPEEKKLSQDDQLWGALSYLWVFSIVALALKKNNDFVRSHANQGALLFILSFIGLIPVFGWFINLIILILAIIGIIKALSGQKWELPILGETAKKFGDWTIKTLKI
ncbi:MAG: hypothetical protein WC517_02115 [Patescibacteria group bacterium]